MDGATTRKRTENMTAAVFAFALASVVCWVYWYGLFGLSGVNVWLVVTALAVLLVVSDLIKIDTTPEDPSSATSYGPWDLLEIAALVLVGPTWATLAALPSAVVSGYRDPLRILFEISNSASRLHLAALPFVLFSSPILAGGASTAFYQWLATALAGLTLIAVNIFLSMLPLRVRHQKSFRSQLPTIMPFWIADLLHVIAASFAAMMLFWSSVTAAVMILLTGALSSFFAYTVSNRKLETKRLNERVTSLEQASVLTNSPFARMVIAELGRRDGFSDRHAAATAVYASDLYYELTSDREHADRVWVAGFLHNIGLYESPRPRQSWRDTEVPEHPRLGANIIERIPGNEDIAKWVLCHHERLDGKGYPSGVKERWIPTEARIIAIAQAYAAMILDKQPPNEEYGETPEAARRMILENINTQFDKRLARTFFNMLDNAPPGYSHAAEDCFMPFELGTITTSEMAPLTQHNTGGPELVQDNDAHSEHSSNEPRTYQPRPAFLRGPFENHVNDRERASDNDARPPDASTED